MKVQYDPKFIRKLKKLDVRIHKSFRQKIALFQKDFDAPELDNHILIGKYDGYRSINITNDYRAIFEIVYEGIESIAYFVIIGIHKELYGE